MIRRISLESFMSHKKTVIEPAPGLTVIVGPNNCGKSAVIVALECLLRNEGGTGVFVRHGEKEAKVTVWTEEGDRIQWIRPAKTGARYTLNVSERGGERLGQSQVPEWLNARLQMPDIEGINVHLSEQKSPIFLLNEKAGVVARFFSSTSDAGLLVRMQKRLLEKKQETTGIRSSLFKEIERQQKLVDRYSGVPDLEVSYRTLESGYAKWTTGSAKSAELSRVTEMTAERTNEIRSRELEVGALRLLSVPPHLADTSRLDQAIGNLKQKIDETERTKHEALAMASLTSPPSPHDVPPLHQICRLMRVALSRQEQWEAKREALSALKEVPTIRETAILETLCDRIASKSSEESGWRIRESILSSVHEPPVLHDVPPLHQLCQHLQVGLALHERSQAKQLALATLKEAPELQETSTLESLCDRIASKSSEESKWNRRESALSSLHEPPVLADLRPLQTHLQAWESEASEVEDKARKFVTQTKALNAALEALRAAVAANPVCPTCGGPLKVESLLKGGHRHE